MLGRRLGLRARSTVAFAGMALVLSSSLALFSYELTRRYLMTNREQTAQRQAFVNARTVRELLRADATEPTAVLSALQLGADGAALVHVGDAWLGTSVGFGQSNVPADLARRVARVGGAGRQRIVDESGAYVVVGVPLPAVGADYFELLPLFELEHTLGTLARTLLVAAVVTTGAGALAGRAASRRVLRPLENLAVAAGRIGEGSLDRLDSPPDGDLAPLVQSFNDMVAALGRRIDRERRFSSDVSHELRSPLAAMAASLNVARRQVDAEPARVALDELRHQVDAFTSLVLDLLEISRAEAGVAEVHVEEVDLGQLVDAVVRSRDASPVEVHAAAGVRVPVDKRRIGQVLANLLDNADRYAGGAVAAFVQRGDGVVRILVDDAGPGVPDTERRHVFERFARGALASAPEGPSGTGLGLALVSEHVRLHGGRVWVEDAPAGGARFVVELPVDGA